MNKPIINGIDVSEYFIDVIDEGGSTIDYKILPNTERLLVEKIFEQNQQLKRLQRENEELKKRQITKNGFICDCEQNAKYKQALEEIRDILCNGRTFYKGYFDTPNLSRTDKAIKVINEVLK